MIGLLWFSAALASVFANTSDAVPTTNIPVSKFSVHELDFACLSAVQPDGSTAKWVELGLDYADGAGVLDFEAQFAGKRDFAVLKDSLQTIEKSADGTMWKIKASGDFEGSPVSVDTTITRNGTKLLADYVIKKGPNTYVGSHCLRSPLPRAVHGYDALLKAYRGERGR